MKRHTNPFPDIRFTLPATLIAYALFIWIVLNLVGCATLSDEKRATLESLGAAIVVTGVVVAVEGHKHAPAPLHHSTIDPPNCAATPSLCR